MQSSVAYHALYACGEKFGKVEDVATPSARCKMVGGGGLPPITANDSVGHIISDLAKYKPASSQHL